MPYIKKDRREDMRWGLTHLPVAVSEGDLNYIFTQAVLGYLKAHGESYATFNAVVGALESAKLEFYRRVVAPYEDTKIAENGDVY